ncbi:hypothetical protein DB346_06285 [Verrucomicrobia bacterium LW23]|nr:hypothetical protein DB346_06285 [Verrucomicrobia bacterium LW23]
MKLTRLLLITCIAALAVAAPLRAQTSGDTIDLPPLPPPMELAPGPDSGDPATAPPVPTVPSAPDSPTAAPAPQAPDSPFMGALRKAFFAFESGDYAESLKLLDEADKLSPRDLNVYTVRATCYLKQKDYAKAEDWYRKAIEIDPSAAAPRFNLAETLFLRKNYAAARVRFDSLLAPDPSSEVLRFKVYMCVLAARQLHEAKAMLRKFDIMGTTPAYHYAQAAWHFAHGEEIPARDWITRAQQVYQPRDFIIFEEALIHMGWLPDPFARKPVRASADAKGEGR